MKSSAPYLSSSPSPASTSMPILFPLKTLTRKLQNTGVKPRRNISVSAMPPKKMNPAPTPTSFGMSSKSPINPTISTPATGGGASGTSTHIPSSILRATPSTVLSTTITPHTDSSPPDDLQGSTSTAPPKKRTRGPNRSKGTGRLISENKLNVTYNKGELHPYGDNAIRFASEIGIIVRDHAPLRVKGWSKIDNGDKEVIYTRIKDKFNLNLNDTDLVSIIDSHCSNRYKNHRNSLHGYYKNMIKNGKNPRAHPPSKVRSNEDWEWLCDNIFSNPQWQK
ncbi:uncharacterized protein LOC21409019 [Morus notabilis]|uniref:uncharacterized protein LOC21409019 n=1 Tax=Morus notabilis TaxID=981085 RepID=UPI000CED2C82|nr:uncharacterized protein LOC21409019 [Morus notabilis]